MSQEVASAVRKPSCSTNVMVKKCQLSPGERPVRFLFISGAPLNEPVAWYGPIVMNTQEELRIAFEEYQNGTFVKHQLPPIVQGLSGLSTNKETP